MSACGAFCDVQRRSVIDVSEGDVQQHPDVAVGEPVKGVPTATPDRDDPVGAKQAQGVAHPRFALSDHRRQVMHADLARFEEGDEQRHPARITQQTKHSGQLVEGLRIRQRRGQTREALAISRRALMRGVGCRYLRSPIHMNILSGNDGRSCWTRRYCALVKPLPQATVARWAVLAGLLAACWIVIPGNVPLYDGVGFPDEPYRFVPTRDATMPAASTATVQLRMVGGVNPGGLVANSFERGPQVSVFAPPQAFEGPASARELVLLATPVPLVRPAPPGQLVSNVYALSFTAAGVPARLRPQAQSPQITLRAAAIPTPLPVIYHRAVPAESWKALSTQQVGADNFVALGPGAGEYVLAQGPRPAAKSSSGKGALLLVLAAAIVLVAVALLVVRRAGGRVNVGEGA